VALVAVIDPDYPMPGSRAVPSSARSASKLMPRALQPVGWVGTRRPRFCWTWTGPGVDFDLVLLDAALDEVHRQRVHGSEAVARDQLADRLATGEQFHWYVEATLQGTVVRSAPVAFGFAR
jgi:hypothetical protein